MKPKRLANLVAGLFMAVPLAATAQSTMQWAGSSVSLGVQSVDEDARDPSKLREYRDLDGTSVLGSFEVRGRSDNAYLNAYGENLGRDDQYLDLKGGSYGRFKYRLYSDELRHNLGSGPGALSPFSGIGSGTLTTTLPRPALAAWNAFDHSYTRQNAGGMAEWQSTSPWYFRVDANQVKREGINVFAGANGTSPGNGFTDLPSPIAYTTRTYSAEAGHSSRRGHFAVNLSHSTFDNENEVLRWNNGFFANGLDTTILPPDNKLTRLSVNGNLRQLSWDSTLAGRLTYSKLTNDVAMLPNILSTGGANPATNPSAPSFHGDVKRLNLALSLSSHPTKALDTRVYLNYAKEDNRSTHMSFAPAAGTGLTGGSADPLSNCNSTATNPCEPELYHLKKTNLGAEAGYRLSRENRVSGGLDYTDSERERADFQKSQDKKVFAQWKNNSLDWLTGRLKYQLLARRSHFEPHVSVLAANPMDLYVRRFDLANVNQNLLKIALDASPAPFVDVGFEAIFKHNDFKDTSLGRTGDKRHELYASLGFGDPSRLRVLVFGDVEVMRFDSSHRVGTGNPDPSAPPTLTTYNWTAENEDKAWQMGLGIDWVPMARLTLKGSFIRAKTTGGAEFAVQPGGAPGPFLPITNFDNTRRTSINLKAVYAYDKQWEFSGGYAHEKYQYSDIGYDNTLYVAGAGATAGVVTGQNSFQPYTADIVYAVAKYKF